MRRLDALDPAQRARIDSPYGENEIAAIAAAANRFCERIDYLIVDALEPASYDSLVARLGAAASRERVYYLSTSPNLFAATCRNLAGTETRRILGAGGNVKLSPTVAVFGGVMQRSAEVSLQKNRAWTLGANFEISPAVTFSAAVYDDDQSGSATLSGSRRVLWLTANYRFSRRTDVYAVIDQNRVAGGYTRPAFMGTIGTQTGVVAGLRHRF